MVSFKCFNCFGRKSGRQKSARLELYTASLQETEDLRPENFQLTERTNVLDEEKQQLEEENLELRRQLASRRPQVIRQLDRLVSDFKESCKRGDTFGGLNSAHYLSDWLIRNDFMIPNEPEYHCCPAGRPLRTKELREHFFAKRFRRSTTPPAHNALVFSMKNSSGDGHVHYGGRDYAAAGTSVRPDHDHYEYYF